MPERSNGHAWKACIRETVSGVRIPLSPRLQKQNPRQLCVSAGFVFGEYRAGAAGVPLGLTRFICDKPMLRAGGQHLMAGMI